MILVSRVFHSGSVFSGLGGLHTEAKRLASILGRLLGGSQQLQPSIPDLRVRCGAKGDGPTTSSLTESPPVTFPLLFFCSLCKWSLELRDLIHCLGYAGESPQFPSLQSRPPSQGLAALQSEPTALHQW